MNILNQGVSIYTHWGCQPLDNNNFVNNSEIPQSFITTIVSLIQHYLFLSYCIQGNIRPSYIFAPIVLLVIRGIQFLKYWNVINI